MRRFPNATYFSGVSNLSFMIQRYRGFRSREIHEAHKQHSALRIGPNTISFTSSEAIRAIYGHSTPCTKGGSYQRLEGSHPGRIDMVNKDDHARKRRILANAFSTRNLEQWEFKIADKIQRLLHQFDRVCQEATPDDIALDFRKWANLFTVEAIADIALSQHLGCLERGNDLVSFATAKGIKRQVPFILGLHAPRRAWSMLVWSTWFRPLKAVLGMIPGYFRRNWELGERFNDLVRYLVHQRIQDSARGDKFDDLTTCLLQDKAGQALQVTDDASARRKFSGACLTIA